MPKVSIIIPFNNGKQYLDQCLKKLSKIEYDDFEIILIDDFSNDKSEKIAKRYTELNLKYYYTTEKTIGVGNARNLGIEKATGDYIMFLDVDDTIDKFLLIDLAKYMKKNIEMIKYKMKITRDKVEKEKGPNFDTIKGEDAFNKLCFKDRYLDSPCLYLIKKELFDRTNLKFEKNIYHEDFGLIPLLLINARTVVSTDIYGYNYYQSDNSIIRDKSDEKQIKKVKDKYFLYDKLEEKLKKMKLKKNTKNNLLEYYTNSIILAIKDLKREDRISFERKIKEKGLLKNIKCRNIKQIVKKIIMKINIELYFKFYFENKK